MLVSRCCKAEVRPIVDYYICDLCYRPTVPRQDKTLETEIEGYGPDDVTEA